MSSESTEFSATDLANLPPETLLYTDDLGRIFNRTERTIRRAVKRGDIPAPAKVFGQNMWTARGIIQHIEKKMGTAQNVVDMERDEKESKIMELSPGGER